MSVSQKNLGVCVVMSNESNAGERLPERVIERLRNEIISEHRCLYSFIRGKEGRLGRWLYRIGIGLHLERNLIDYVEDLELLNNVKGKRVLELGCGYGRMAAQLAARGAVVHTVDISRLAVEVTSKRLRDAGLHHNVEVHHNAPTFRRKPDVADSGQGRKRCFP